MSEREENDREDRGRLVVVSGPSGAGKTTLLRRVSSGARAAGGSVSATTRPPRPGETDGVDYHFLTADEFDAAAGRRVHRVLPGVRQRVLVRHAAERGAAGLRAGKWVVLNIDVQGGLAVLEQFPDAVTIFVRPGSMEELERRLRGRGTESESVHPQRLQRAKYEMTGRSIRPRGRQRQPGAGSRRNLCNFDSPMGDM